MATQAYFTINLEKRFSDDGYYLEAIRELEAIPEVKEVKPVSGAYDLLVKVEAPIRTILVANKIRAKKWVKNFRVLNVEPAQPAEASEPAKLLKA